MGRLQCGIIQPSTARKCFKYASTKESSNCEVLISREFLLSVAKYISDLENRVFKDYDTIDKLRGDCIDRGPYNRLINTLIEEETGDSYFGKNMVVEAAVDALVSDLKIKITEEIEFQSNTVVDDISY